MGLERLRQYYIIKLKERDLITKSERIRWNELISKFNQFYSSSFLGRLNSLVNVGDEDTWFHKVLRSPRVTCHPLRHILILGFLGETVVSMYDYFTENNNLDKPIRRKRNRAISKATNNQLKIRIDWEQRDVEIARNVRSIADLLINDTVLKRVTKTEIARRLRIQALLARAIDKLPRTKEALDEVVESLEQFQKRRIRKVINELIKERAVVQSWEVIRIAGLKKKYADKLEQYIVNEIFSNQQTS